MPAVHGKDIKAMLEDRTKGPAFVSRHIAEALQSKQLAPDDFSIKDIFVSVVPDGREMVESFNPRGRGGFVGTAITEAADAVSSSHFSNITGQLLYTTIMQQAQAEDYVFSRIIPTVQTQFSGERIPGVANLGDDAQVVAEGDEFPLAGFNEDWIDTPETVKRGNIVPLTKEAIFFDRTALVLSTAGQVGLRLGANKEKRLIKAVIDETHTTHRYKWRGTSYATFQGTTPWVNLIGSATLIDWTDINAAEQAAADLLDPNTGEPMPMMMKEIIVAPELAATAAMILNGTGMQYAGGGFATSNQTYVSNGPNPIGNSQYSGRYAIVSSRLLKTQMTTNTTWYLGNIAAAVEYRQNWPITVEMAGADSSKAFERDIVVQYKASERGAAFVKEPRYLIKNTVA